MFFVIRYLDTRTYVGTLEFEKDTDVYYDLLQLTKIRYSYIHTREVEIVPFESVLVK